MNNTTKNEFHSRSAGRRRRAFKAAFPYTIPIMAGFLFLGIAYGIYMSTSGFFFLYPTFMGMLIFGGSLEFVAVSMLLSPFAPLSAFVIAFMIQCRHLFYGIAMLDQYKGMGWKKFFLIFGLCDETFSLNYTIDIPEDIDRGWFMLSVTWLNQLYWITGATIGGLAGSMIHFSTDGLSFVMTSMFVVIFLEQWRKEKVRLSAFVGFAASAVCLLLFGADSFMVPTVIAILVLLTMLRRPMEQRYQHFEETGEISEEKKKTSEKMENHSSERENDLEKNSDVLAAAGHSFNGVESNFADSEHDLKQSGDTQAAAMRSFHKIEGNAAEPESAEETTEEGAK